MILAGFEARRLHFNKMEPQHLALGFVIADQDDSPSEPKKPRLDSLKAHTLAAELSWPGPCPSALPDSQAMHLTQEAASALRTALDYATGAKVTPSHVLWGVLDQEGSPAADCLTRNGITKEWTLTWPQAL